MKLTYTIITLLGFISLILGYFLATTLQGGIYFQGFGAGLILSGSTLTVHQYLHERKLKKETVEKN
jgi:hypothetical protein